MTPALPTSINDCKAQMPQHYPALCTHLPIIIKTNPFNCSHMYTLAQKKNSSLGHVPRVKKKACPINIATEKGKPTNYNNNSFLVNTGKY